VVGGQIGTAQDKSGHVFQGTFFLLFFASDFKIESNMGSPISRKEDWLKARFQESRISIFQERMKARKQD